MWAGPWENVLRHLRTTKAQISLLSLISAFVVRCSDSIISLDFYSRNFKTLASFYGTKRKTVGQLHVSRAMRKCVLRHMWKTKAHISLRSLISFFVVRCLDSISLDSIAEISRTLATFCGKKRKTVGQLYVSRAMKKCVLRHMRTTKAQISLRIRAVWSAPLLFAA